MQFDQPGYEEAASVGEKSLACLLVLQTPHHLIIRLLIGFDSDVDSVFIKLNQNINKNSDCNDI